jgi:hypothetical protein
MTTISIQTSYSGRERIAVISAAPGLGIEWVVAPVSAPGTIPIGTVEYCEPLFGPNRKDFYPQFLQWDYQCRTLYFYTGSETIESRCFVKDATRWKSPDWSRIVEPGEQLPDGKWVISPVVKFTQEWRYYVANGSVVTTGWYKGTDEDEPAPPLDVEWPRGFSGAVDMGRLDDGRIALVEACAPFACGWYGEDHRDYLRWLTTAWEHREWWLDNPTV